MRWPSPTPPSAPLLVAEQSAVMDRIAGAVADTGRKEDLAAALAGRLDLDRIENVVVIYAENRSFNNLFANFPGATGVPRRRTRRRRAARVRPQKDRDGTVLAKLPPAWGGLTAAGQPVTVTQAQTTNVLPNAPFQIDAAAPAWGGPALANTIITRDLYHRFYENQMQIDGGLNDKFAAWGDSGGVVMGYFDGSRTAMWKIARDYTLADRFFQGAFGGSYLNHQYLICACAARVSGRRQEPGASVDHRASHRRRRQVHARPRAGRQLARVGARRAAGVQEERQPDAQGLSRRRHLPQRQHDAAAVPAQLQPADAGRHRGPVRDPLEPTTLPAQTLTTIGDLLNGKGVAWTWYSGGWNAAWPTAPRSTTTRSGNFQSHHQPFNYYAALDPKTHAADRAAHLKDYTDLVADAAAGKLPAVAFYKPIGKNNEHPGYASLAPRATRTSPT
jgi:acid phosphatase